jgi:hypothetical protein
MITNVRRLGSAAYRRTHSQSDSSFKWNVISGVNGLYATSMIRLKSFQIISLVLCKMGLSLTLFILT